MPDCTLNQWQWFRSLFSAEYAAHTSRYSSSSLSKPAARIRWDRVGRVAHLVVLVVVVAL